jgi:hypothetical protein
MRIHLCGFRSNFWIMDIHWQSVSFPLYGFCFKSCKYILTVYLYSGHIVHSNILYEKKCYFLWKSIKFRRANKLNNNSQIEKSYLIDEIGPLDWRSTVDATFATRPATKTQTEKSNKATTKALDISSMLFLCVHLQIFILVNKINK